MKTMAAGVVTSIGSDVRSGTLRWRKNNTLQRYAYI